MHAATILSCVCYLAVLSAVAAYYVHMGNDAPPALYRFFVDMSTCGGAMISSRFMITAAHCVVNGKRRDMEITTRNVKRVQWTKSHYKRRFPLTSSTSHITHLFENTHEFWTDTGGPVPDNLMLSDYAIVELEEPVVSVCDDESGPLAVLLPTEDDETAENMFKADRHHQCLQAGFGKQINEKEPDDLMKPKQMKQLRITNVVVESTAKGRILESSARPGVHVCGGDSGTPVFCIVDDNPILMSLGNTGPACGGTHSLFYGPDIHDVLPQLKKLVLRSEWKEIMKDQKKCRAYYKENGFLNEYVARINKNQYPTYDGFEDSRFVYPPAHSINMDGAYRGTEPHPPTIPVTQPSPVPEPTSVPIPGPTETGPGSDQMNECARLKIDTSTPIINVVFYVAKKCMCFFKS